MVQLNGNIQTGFNSFSSPIVSADGIVYSMSYSTSSNGLKCMFYAI